MERHPKPISSTSIFLAERNRLNAIFHKPVTQNRFLPSSSALGEQKVIGTGRQRVRTGLTPVITGKRPVHAQVVIPEQEIWAKRDSRRIDDALSALVSANSPPLKGKYTVKSPKRASGKEKKREIMGLIAGREKNGAQTGQPITRLEELLSRWDLPKKYLLIRQNPPRHRPEPSAKSSSLSLKDERRLIYELSPETQFGLRGLESVRKEETISIKEAMRDREWLARCKEIIVKEFHSHVLHSFAVGIEPATVGPASFRVYIAPGNNSHLVKKVFAARWWWTRVDEAEKLSANLLWTQWKDKSWLATMESLTPHDYRPTSPWIVDSPLRYNPYNGGNVQSLTGRVVDLSPLCFDLVTKSASFICLETNYYMCAGRGKTHNKLEGNQHLANKKALFVNLKRYYECVGKDPFQVIPLTFHVREGERDAEFAKFEEAHRKLIEANEQISDPAKRSKLVWILKPGENTNRGTGITLCNSIDSVKEEMKAAVSTAKPGVKHTFIVQKYLEKPLLINRRKFDIRLYALLVSANGLLQAYFYREGYIRTSSKEFSLSNLSNKLIHLTNDAVQKHSEDYGKFEMANKLSYSELQRYLETHCRDKCPSFLTQVVPRMREIVKDTVQAVFLKVNPGRREYSFEIFGYDFMLDEALTPWLIEVNTNPCLELSSPLLARIIPSMLENAFKLAIDPFFPEPSSRRGNAQDSISENKFELIFHELVDGQALKDQVGSSIGDLAVDDPTLKDVEEESEDRGECEDADGC